MSADNGDSSDVVCTEAVAASVVVVKLVLLLLLLSTLERRWKRVATKHLRQWSR